MMMSCKVVLTFEFVEEILRCDHSNKTSLEVFSHGNINAFQHLTRVKCEMLLNFNFGCFGWG